MKALQFVDLRRQLGKTQQEIARILGKSLKAVNSYEQDWRRIPPNVERMMLFLLARKKALRDRPQACWQIWRCPDERKEKCPAWEYRCGEICWFINGTICAGQSMDSWKEKIEICHKCKVFQSVFGGDPNGIKEHRREEEKE